MSYKAAEQHDLSVEGRVFIRDAMTHELVLDKRNAIHPQHMAKILARGLANESANAIFKLCFGNGGTFTNSSGQLIYRAPNTYGSANLYNQTYEVHVDESAAGTPATNSVVSLPSPAPAVTSLVIVSAQLSASEPVGQAVADNITTDPDAPYIFDEIGLKTSDGLLLTHLVFSPIEKTANRAFIITYTLTISAS